MHIRKMISFLLSAILLFCSTGNALCEEANPDYTRVGLKVTGLMSEIVDSTDFLDMFISPNLYGKVREEVNTHDYDRPLAVYTIKSDPQMLLENLLLSDAKTKKTFESLSPTLQDQLLRRISIQSVCSLVNGRAGSEYIAFFSVATAVILDDSLDGEKGCSYLFIFEKGIPILVSFGYHVATGSFLYIPGGSRKNREAIQSFLGIPGMEVAPVIAGKSPHASSGNLAGFGIDAEDAFAKNEAGH